MEVWKHSGHISGEDLGIQPIPDARLMAHMLDAISEAVIMRDAEGRFLFANARAESLLGAPLAELIGRKEDPKLQFTTLEGTPIPLDAYPALRAISTGQTVEGLELAIKRPDGTRVVVLATAAPIAGENGAVAGAVLTLTDLTERKVAEDKLKDSLERLRRIDHQRMHLLDRLVTAQEQERKRIAEDLHDDSVQAMVAVRLKLQRLAGRLDGEARAMLESLDETTENAIARLRHLLFELRPPSLEEDGLAAGLELMLKQLRNDAGLEAILENRLEREPAPGARVIIYRICQEAAANIRHHAGARYVHVVLKEHRDGVLTSIADDGVGFEAEPNSSNPGHLGLAAMRDRAEMAGGWCEVESAPEKGTTVHFWVPSSRLRI